MSETLDVLVISEMKTLPELGSGGYDLERSDVSSPQIFTNLEFEYELFMPNLRKLSPAVREHGTRFQHILRLLPGLERASLWTPGKSPDDLTPWGVTPALAEGKRFPRLSVVREVNDKRFSHKVEQEFGIALPYSTLVKSSQELETRVAACPHDWVLKHPFGVSGRERMLNWAGVITESVAGWARKLFAQGLSLVFEPWVSERIDYSLHYQIENDFSIRYLGRCEIVPDQGGVYRGNLHEPEARKPDIADRVIERVARSGYWGPVSLDCFRGTLAGFTVERPLVEINARHTFGRLTLALRRWAPEGSAMLWWHPMKPPVGDYPRLPNHADMNCPPGWYRLPEFADPDDTTGTLVGIASTAQDLLTNIEANSLVSASPPGCK